MSAFDRHTEADIEFLREHYFMDPARQQRLAAGEVLLRPGQYNERLYLIREGILVGEIRNEAGDRFQIFRSGEDQLVGVYSFFSHEHLSYSTVWAETDSVLAYLDAAELRASGRYEAFADRMLPIVVSEIYLRQLDAQRMAVERQMTIRKLIQTEKLASLGQMAAGLAHELNNAIGVIQQKSEWLSSRFRDLMREQDQGRLYALFLRGYESGQTLSSAEVRERRRELEEKLELTPALAKKLAKTGLSDEELRPYVKDIDHTADQLIDAFETGLMLHDMELAANHAARVVRSVKELGAAHHSELRLDTDISQTIREALSLLKKMLEKVQLDINLQPVPLLPANPGELVQVWVNLIKNAVEAMENANTYRPRLRLSCGLSNGNILVSVEDNGPGIPEEIQQRIFQPDFTTKSSGLSFGLGLGLAIVQTSVENHGGHIYLDSRPGKTVFSVYFPAASP